MSNAVTGNITEKLLKKFIPDMESQKVLCKTIDTQLFDGMYDPSSGPTIKVKRPHRYWSYESADGDISSNAADNDLISGTAVATVQNYISIKIPFTNYQEALYLNQLDLITTPAAEELITKLELNLGKYMMKNCGLAFGDPDTAVDAWSDIAGPMALMKSLGVPSGNKYYAMNPYTSTNLANLQSALAGSDQMIKTAWEEAQVTSNVAGITVLSTDSLANRTSTTAADKAGSLTAAPDLTYATAKNSMTQTWAVTGFSDTTLKAGDILEVTGKYYVNPKTRQVFVDAAGDAVKFRAIVTADVNLGTSGEGNVVVSAPGLWTTNGQYNTTNAALASSDVITIIATTATLYQPNLFYHKNAFSLATVKLPKLYSTDTVATTSNGFSIRCSKYSDGDANTQSIRFDILPAFATLNPFWAGQGFGV